MAIPLRYITTGEGKRYVNERIFMKYFIVFFTIFIISASPFISAALSNENGDGLKNILKNQYMISDIGLKGIVEIGMALEDLQRKGIHYEEMKSHPDITDNLGRFYKIESLGIEFQIMKIQIIKIWLFSKKYKKSSDQFVLCESPKIISNISANDIISCFGDVKVFLTENPDNSDKPYWVKYDPFKVGINYIVYPNNPYLFTFDSADMLSSITVSSEYD
jgi:hypothetical protein